LSSEIQQISTPDAILRIKKLIETKRGDRGRLEYISESLQKGKHLFRSDRIYLHNKILADVIPAPIKKPTETEEKIKKVKRLISLNFGEPGRLQHILHSLQNNRELYHSDEQYIELKNDQFLQFRGGRRLKKGVRGRIPTIPKPEKYEEMFSTSISEIPREQPPAPLQDIPEKLQEIEEAVLSTKPQETSDSVNLFEEASPVNLEIEEERQKISKLKHDHEKIKIQREELSKLIVYRQEYEIKINREKEVLEKEIKIEQEKVNEKDKLVEELIKNQSKIIQTKTEREVLLEQIKNDKTKSDLQLKKEQDELEKIKKEYEDMQNEIRSKKHALDEQIRKEEERVRKLKEDSEEN